MKVRTDFVTNSSSSCYVTFLIETNDGKHYAGAFVGDEIGHFDGGISSAPQFGCKEFSLKDALNGKNGKDLLKVIDMAYNGLFSEHDELNTLFEDDEPYHLSANLLKENGITWPIGGQKELEETPMDNIKTIHIMERQEGDEFGANGELIADFVCRKEHLIRSGAFASIDFEAMEDEDFDGEPPEVTVETDHEEIRNWENGEINVLKDEENIIRDDEEDNE